MPSLPYLPWKPGGAPNPRPFGLKPGGGPGIKPAVNFVSLYSLFDMIL